MVMPALLTEDLERREAVLGVDVEHLPDEILGSRRDVRPRLAGEVELAAEDGGEDAVLILRPEGSRDEGRVKFMLVHNVNSSVETCLL